MAEEKMTQGNSVQSGDLVSPTMNAELQSHSSFQTSPYSIEIP